LIGTVVARRFKGVAGIKEYTANSVASAKFPALIDADSTIASFEAMFLEKTGDKCKWRVF
jgi:hypothetical protein